MARPAPDRWRGGRTRRAPLPEGVELNELGFRKDMPWGETPQHSVPTSMGPLEYWDAANEDDQGRLPHEVEPTSLLPVKYPGISRIVKAERAAILKGRAF